jgi:hypothetical protein
MLRMAHWPITLDDAILIALHDAPNRTASISHIAEAINKRRLYVQRGGGEVFPKQVFLRAKNDPRFFQVVDRTVVKSLFASTRRTSKAAS